MDLDRMHTYAKCIAAVFGALAGYLWGGWTAPMGALAALVVLDYATGFTAAAIHGQLSSSVGWRGIARKVAIFSLIAVAHLADTVLGDQHILRDATTFFYVANEAISILENTGRMGLPIAPVLQRAIQALQDKGDDEKGE